MKTLLHSTVLHGRSLTIYEPPDLREPAPLLIMHDGQNLFDADRAFGGSTWHVSETLDALIAAGTVPPVVVAGIDHAGDRRVAEYGHRASAYGRFIVRDVLPYMRRAHRVRDDRAGTWMAGSSMGGLVTLRIAVEHPDVLGRLFVFSPSVWWNRRAILKAIRRPGILGELFTRSRGLADDVDVWLSIGLQEGAEAVSDARLLRDAIIAKRHGDASRLAYYEDPEGTHSESAWAAQFKIALSGAGIPSAGAHGIAFDGA